MTIDKIIKIIAIEDFILAIYKNSSDYYRYSIIDEYGVVYEPDEIFSNLKEVERAARETINSVF